MPDLTFLGRVASLSTVQYWWARLIGYRSESGSLINHSQPTWQVCHTCGYWGSTAYIRHAMRESAAQQCTVLTALYLFVQQCWPNIVSFFLSLTRKFFGRGGSQSCEGSTWECLTGPDQAQTNNIGGMIGAHAHKYHSNSTPDSPLGGIRCKPST